jgi:MinD-like ATPase involved in chromosome partitioning or flagellar assembly
MPAEAVAYGLAEAAAAHAPAETVAQAPAEAAPPEPAETVAQAPAEAAPPEPAETVAQAPAGGAAQAPAEDVPQPPAGAAAHGLAEASARAPAEAVPHAPAQAAPFTTPEASQAPPEAPPAVPAEHSQPAEPAAPSAGPAPPSSPIVVVRGGNGTRPAAVERALGAPGQQRAGTSWREHVRVVPGGHGPGRPDMERRDRARVLLPIRGPRLIVVLGCTVGAGQTVTALMLADVLASLRTEPVAALDLNPGQTSLAELAGISPAATARGLLAGQQAPGPRNPGPRNPGQPDLIAHDSVADGRPDLPDADYARLIRILADRYPLTLTDPGATAVARVLAAADQLVLVAPASADAAQAVTMTMEWLDGHGYGDLVTNAIAVINGVSKRSMTHVEQAELVVRGRCRATVRVPWDDHLGAPRDEQIAATPGGPGTGDASRFGQLRPQVQHAYTALAGVLVSALAVEPARPHGAAT